MKLSRKIAIVLLPLAAACASAHAADPFAQDKQKHFGVSFVLGVGAEQVVARTLPQYDSVFLGTAIALVPGVLKEVADQRSKNRTGHGEGFSSGDLAADALGAFAGAALSKYVSGRLSVLVDRDVAGARRVAAFYTLPLN